MNDHPAPTRVLVVGAKTGSLGDCIAGELRGKVDEVIRAGITREPVHLDVRDWDRCREVMGNVEPTHVICTVGANVGDPFYAPDWQWLAKDLMDVNYIGPMNVLSAFENWLDGMPGTFVAISSNSASVARSSSAAYCASKAALSMGLRCAARDATRAGKPLAIWGYEPGALLATPMTSAVAGRLGADVPMSRMLTNPAGLPTMAVARIVARDVLDSGAVLHGTVVRLDNGDS